MQSEKPGRRSFYKYLSPDATLAILESGKLRYGSPKSFNDPFDMAVNIDWDFNIRELHEKLLSKLEIIASSPEEPKVDPTDPWGKIARLAWVKYPSHGFPRDQFQALSGEHISQLAMEFESTRKQYQQWWESKASDFRVFCVSEERDNLLMWAHYAKDHAGAVVELLSLPEEDNLLSAASKVEYVEKPLPFFTESEWIDEIFSINRINFSKLYYRYPTVKSLHWAYENEWRVWYPLSETPTSPYDEIPLRASEFKAIYLGCKASNSFSISVRELVKSKFHNTLAFKARKKPGVFGLKYNEI